MKIIFFLLLVSPLLFSQHAKHSMEVKGTEFILDYSDHDIFSKAKNISFINTLTGETTKVALPEGMKVQSVESIQFPGLSINHILVILVSNPSSKSVITNQVFLLSSDGLQNNEIDIQKNVVTRYIVNTKTGRIVFFLHQGNTSTNREEEKILIYDLISRTKL